MFNLLADYFHDILFGDGCYLEDIGFELFGESYNMSSYLSYLLALVTCLVIFVLCCLFVYKIIRLIGGLIR